MNLTQDYKNGTKNWQLLQSNTTNYDKEKVATSNSCFCWNSPKVECYNVQHIQRTYKSDLWVDVVKEKLKNIFCFYLWFLLQGFGLQGSLEMHDPNSNWLSWSPTQRAMHALGYVRPFWPQTGTNWSTQLQGKPARATHGTGTGCTFIFHGTRYIRYHWGISAFSPFLPPVI